MKVLVLGGNGYLGWPTAMHLATAGMQVHAVDNYYKQHCFAEVGASCLFAGERLDARVSCWNALHPEQAIAFSEFDLTDIEALRGLLQAFQPDAIIHYAEQPSAPYSMMGAKQAQSTMNNNLNVTLNLIHAIHDVCPQTHLIKLGTMGEYGTPNIDIEEGWIDIEKAGRSDRFLFPRQAGSLYHTTKVMDTDLLWFYVRTWGLRVTDLMQGPVYGLLTEPMQQDDRLLTHFSYDEVFGTVLNRFIVQAVMGIPLTVYGKGEQKRGFLNIVDTMRCLELAVKNPAKPGTMNIYNQFTEVFSVNQLAEHVLDAASALQLPVTVNHLENPRIEKEEHYYNPRNTSLLSLGLQPTLLTTDIVKQMMEKIIEVRDQIDASQIFRGVGWDRNRQVSAAEPAEA